MIENEQLARRIREAAARENQSAEELLSNLVGGRLAADSVADEAGLDESAGSLHSWLQFAPGGRERGWPAPGRGQSGDARAVRLRVDARARRHREQPDEILRTEYADYLLRRMRDQGNEDAELSCAA